MGNEMNKNLADRPSKGRPFQVRLPTTEIREAFEKYCADNLRSLDAQSSMLIIQELQKLGYLDNANNLSIKRATINNQEGR